MNYFDSYLGQKRSSLHCWGMLLSCLFVGSNLFAAPLNNCNVGFSYQTLYTSDISLSKVVFTNTSTGDFTSVMWDFGDGQYSSSANEQIEHNYQSGGVFEISLTIWNADESCFDQIFDEITLDGIVSQCDVIDCVLPGNTNDDDQADLSDLINLGMGFGATGPARENTSFDWIPRPGDDWPQETPDGINFKHLDCNGDGTINAADIMPILYNYSPMNTGIVDIEEGGPRVYLQPDNDTIYINENSPETMTISAGLIIGESTEPIEDLYGMTVQVGFDSSYVQPIQGVGIDFNQNSFIADDQPVLNYGQPIRKSQKVDLAVTRLGGVASNGYGRIATISYIIIVDIIGGRTVETTSFKLPITGIKVIDANGMPVDIDLDINPAKVVFVNEEVTSIIDPALAKQVKVYPNPVIDQMTIDLGDLKGTQIELFNTIGQKVHSETMSGSQMIMDTESFRNGLYLLQVTTAEGTLTKRILMQ